MTPAVPTAAVPGNTNVMQKVGFRLLLLLLVLIVSRATEYEEISSLHLPLFLVPATAVAAVLSGNLWTGIRSPVGLHYILLTALFYLGVPFAEFNRGGIIHRLDFVWLPCVLYVVCVMGLGIAYRESKALINVLAYSGVIAACLSIVAGQVSKEGRLAVESGTFGNPNYLGLVLVLSIPALWRLQYNAGVPSIPRKVVFSGLMLLCVVQMFKTGSRAGFIGLGLTLTAAFWSAPAAKKLSVIVTGAVLLAVLLVAVPDETRSRLLHMAPDSSEGVTGSADASTTSREMLIGESLKVAITHPVFGVGVDNFAMYINLENQRQGRSKEQFLGTHNTYTQIAAEAGLPSLGVFLWLLGTSWRQLTRLIRAAASVDSPAARDVHASASAMRITLIALCGFMLFFHLGYYFVPHLIVALCVNTARSGEMELARGAAAGVPVQRPGPGVATAQQVLAGASV